MIGALKTHTGHCEYFTGLASLVASAISTARGSTQPNLNLKKFNQLIPIGDFAGLCQTQLTNSAATKSIGVSSFGFSGTNSHVVLQSTPQRKQVEVETVTCYACSRFAWWEGGESGTNDGLLLGSALEPSGVPNPPVQSIHPNQCRSRCPESKHTELASSNNHSQGSCVGLHPVLPEDFASIVTRLVSSCVPWFKEAFASDPTQALQTSLDTKELNSLQGLELTRLLNKELATNKFDIFVVTKATTASLIDMAMSTTSSLSAINEMEMDFIIRDFVYIQQGDRDIPPLIVLNTVSGLAVTGDLQDHMTANIPIVALHAPEMSGRRGSPSLRLRAQEHAQQIAHAFPTTQHVNLLGYSLGGPLAYWVACELQHLAKTVAVVLADPAPVGTSHLQKNQNYNLSLQAKAERLDFVLWAFAMAKSPFDRRADGQHFDHTYEDKVVSGDIVTVQQLMGCASLLETPDRVQFLKQSTDYMSQTVGRWTCGDDPDTLNTPLPTNATSQCMIDTWIVITPDRCHEFWNEEYGIDAGLNPRHSALFSPIFYAKELYEVEVKGTHHDMVNPSNTQIIGAAIVSMLYHEFARPSEKVNRTQLHSTLLKTQRQLLLLHDCKPMAKVLCDRLEALECNLAVIASDLPTLTKSGYLSDPPLQRLQSMSAEGLAAVRNFMVSRPGFGSIMWEGNVDLRGVDLDSIKIDQIGVVVDLAQTPTLNCACLMSRENVFPDVQTTAHDMGAYQAKLVGRVAQNGHEFVNFDHVRGVLTFRVQRLSGGSRKSSESRAITQETTNQLHEGVCRRGLLEVATAGGTMVTQTAAETSEIKELDKMEGAPSETMLPIRSVETLSSLGAAIATIALPRAQAGAVTQIAETSEARRPPKELGGNINKEWIDHQSKYKSAITTEHGFLELLVPTEQVCAMSDLHLDEDDTRMEWLDRICAKDNTRHTLLLVGHVHSDTETLFSVLLRLCHSFQYVIFCPGDVDRATQQPETTFWETLRRCHKLGIITVPCMIGKALCVVPIHSTSITLPPIPIDDWVTTITMANTEQGKSLACSLGATVHVCGGLTTSQLGDFDRMESGTRLVRYGLGTDRATLDYLDHFTGVSPWPNVHYEPGEVLIVHGFNEVTDSGLMYLLQLCPAERVGSFRREITHVAKVEVIMSYLLQRMCCTRYARSETSCAIRKTKAGKPFLANRAPKSMNGPNFNYNVSHDNGYLALIWHSEYAVGIDVSGSNVPTEENEFCDLVFSQDEKDILSSCRNTAESNRIGKILWGLKEAYLKAIGVGIAANLPDVSFCMREEGSGENQRIRNIQVKHNGVIREHWHFAVQEREGVFFAMCVGPPTEIVDENGEFRKTFKMPEALPKQSFKMPQIKQLDIDDLVPLRHRRSFQIANSGSTGVLRCEMPLILKGVVSPDAVPVFAEFVLHGDICLHPTRGVGYVDSVSASHDKITVQFVMETGRENASHGCQSSCTKDSATGVHTYKRSSWRKLRFWRGSIADIGGLELCEDQDTRGVSRLNPVDKAKHIKTIVTSRIEDLEKVESAPPGVMLLTRDMETLSSLGATIALSRSQAGAQDNEDNTEKCR